MQDKRTPLYEEHQKLNAKITGFAGYAMPVRYSGDSKEHLAVRQQAGLFDVSHMGEVTIKGPKALDAVQRLITNDASKMKPGRALYSPMCYPDGNTVDDIIIMKVADDDFFICVNASNREKDVAWMQEQVSDIAKVTDVSDEYALLAIQGPKAREVVHGLIDDPRLPKMRRFAFADVAFQGVPVRVSRTGYTGEDGYEIYCLPSLAGDLWNAILEQGKPAGLLPCGLGARDSLRLEAALPLYGHEISAAISPIEGGLGWTVKTRKADFIGRDALVAQVEKGTERKLFGIITEGRRAIPREGYVITDGERPIGTVTSGLFSPLLKKGIALALLDGDKVQIGDEVSLTIRGRSFPAQVTPLPFVTKST